MGVLSHIVELRTWPTTTLTDATSVTADTEIIELSTIIENTDVSFISIQCAFSVAGQLYVQDENGNKMYLTDPSQDYPAKFQILSTFLVKKGKTMSLRYTSSGTMYHLIVVTNGGLF